MPGPKLNRAKCPLCKIPVIPSSTNNDSPLLEQMRTLLGPTKWAAHLPPAPPKHQPAFAHERSPPPITNGAQSNNDDEANLHAHDHDHVNGGTIKDQTSRASPSMITIEMGVRPSFSLPPHRQPDEPKVHAPPSRMASGTGRRPTATFLGTTDGSAIWKEGGPLRGSLGILLNCLTLRNLRLCSFGISPRQSLLFLLLIILLVLASVHWFLPLFASASPPPSTV